MKILFIQWGIESHDILWGLVELGEEVEIYPEIVSVQDYREQEREMLSQYLREHKFQIVFSYYFIPSVSDACQMNDILYISWVVDSPQIELYTRPALNSCNYIFVFDKIQYRRMKQRNLSHLFYMPLATNVARVSGLELTSEDILQYSSQISFVGNLYERNHYNLECCSFTSNVKKQLDQIIMRYALHWRENESLFGSVDAGLCALLEKYVLPWDKYQIDKPYFYELYYIARKVTEIDRVCILNALSLKHKVDLYTSSNTAALQGVIVHGRVTYQEEAPKVYNLSKINLNITMRTIESGVPQRVFDIMGAGGFVMSNYQSELEELFVVDEEIVLFHDLEELVCKVRYYLEHEQERIRIAMNGYRRVLECYNSKRAVSEILKTVRGEHLK